MEGGFKPWMFSLETLSGANLVTRHLAIQDTFTKLDLDKKL